MLRRRAVSLIALSPLLACEGGLSYREGCDVASFVQYAGRVLPAGDSIVEGHNALLGGWRPGLFSALSAAGVQSVSVGPVSDAYGNHWGVSGAAAYLQAPYARATCEAQRPRCIYIAIGINDIGFYGRTAAQTVTALRYFVAEARAGYPYVIPFVQTLIVPQNDTFPAYWDARDEVSEVNTLLPSACLSEGAILVDVGAPPCPDGVHPSQSGYTDTMAPIIAAAFLRNLPGAP